MQRKEEKNHEIKRSRNLPGLLYTSTPPRGYVASAQSHNKHVADVIFVLKYATFKLSLLTNGKLQAFACQKERYSSCLSRSTVYYTITKVGELIIQDDLSSHFDFPIVIAYIWAW